MSSNWNRYTVAGLDLASTATSFGFSAAKAGTKLGFAITRGIASTAAGITGTALDHALFGGSIGAGPLLGGAVSSAISSIETLALAPILIGESLTSTSLVAAQSTLSVLDTIFPGSDEASFSLASFVGLVRREWAEPADFDGLPEERFGLAETMGALAAWATLQGVTNEWHERQWFKNMTEIPVNDESMREREANAARHGDARVHITTDVVYPSNSGQIVTADIGEAPSSPPLATPSTSQSLASSYLSGVHPFLSNSELKQTLRRLSKIVLAGYGGPSLLFFGVSPLLPRSSSSVEKEKIKEEDKLTQAVGASEAQASTSTPVSPSNDDAIAQYPWWDVLMGRHDREIFLHYANSEPPTPAPEPDLSQHQPTPRPATALVGIENHMPRFWVLTDHVRCEVVLVIRGTMSLNELAVDLTCEPAPFELESERHRSRSRSRPRTADDNLHGRKQSNEEMESIPGSFPMDISIPSPPQRKRPLPQEDDPVNETEAQHLVHGGMLKMARAMGGRRKPVHVAVRDALQRNRGYSLVLCGHSLGAGVAALLALMWANPHTRLTHRRSGLPRHRTVSAYCFAPPCLTSARLAELAGEAGLITSFAYSHDVVSRLSLGSVRDMKRAAMWLCVQEGKEGLKEGEEKREEGYAGVTRRALKWVAGYGEDGDEEWFLAMRKTLEANMHMTQLYPPGRVFWALRDGDLHPMHRLRSENGSGSGSEKVRLFSVHPGKAQEVFRQIVFARDMLSSHLPQEYDRVLHELL
ncbi:alpha/beta-hydrolase [Sparassis crispa]|uniref:sn-1-specific diacylglycerol lipase n=1 Tax=Sparassis crispa TaxID=139825 RepID=A0A401G9V2_9APHY|nr:alpha/beta-hydrolase [Sparassis crispa]GBE78954.1 alpha/beta-hydrolase [Sparassis crispa]